MLSINEDTPTLARDMVFKELETVLSSFDKIKSYIAVDTNLSNVILYDVEFCRQKVKDVRRKLFF